MNAPLVLSVLVVLFFLILLLRRSARRSSDLKWSIIQLLREAPDDCTEKQIWAELRKRSKLFKRISRPRLYTALRNLERNGYITSYRKPLTHPDDDRFYQIPPINMR